MNTTTRPTLAAAEFRSNASSPIAVRIDEVKVYEKRTLKAFLDFTFTDIGMRINGAMIHEKDGRRWIGMPAREYQTNEGRAWSPVVDFSSKKARAAVNDSVLAAYNRYNAAHETL
jgi:DNA-binding cell septation regulator SpoVG